MLQILVAMLESGEPDGKRIKSIFAELGWQGRTVGFVIFRLTDWQKRVYLE